ncbi:MAG: DUF2344 domain-containing protein [Anaerolineae bacterium]|nr:DUF2344 domain-containing protein [Anaerolineae bacterium]
MSHPPEMFRVRITFGKLDALRFIGHLDLAKTWERVLRRAQVPLVYSQGFNPQPKMQLAAALPLGISSECELLDIWLLEQVELGVLPARLEAVSPAGLKIYGTDEVPLKAPALQAVLTRADYRITVDEVDAEVLADRVRAFLASEQVMREKRGKLYDLRPLVLSLEARGNEVQAGLTIGSQGNARPDDLLDALGLSFERARCHRVGLSLDSDAPA